MVIRYIVESMSHDFVAYRENNPEVVESHPNAGGALQKLLHREQVQQFQVGTRVMVYDGMGESSYGIVTGPMNEEDRVPVRMDGYWARQGPDSLPYETHPSWQYIKVDPDGENARADAQTWKQGYKRIEATLDE